MRANERRFRARRGAAPAHDRHAPIRARAVAGRAHPGAARRDVSLERGRAARDDHRGRSGAGSAARGRRRQGPLHQGARSGDGGRPRRSRRPFAQGRADGHARGIRAGGDHRARGPARRVRVEPLSRSRGAAGRRAHRHVEPAARSAAARARPAAVDPAAARQRQHAPAQARRGPLRRHHPRRRRA